MAQSQAGEPFANNELARQMAANKWLEVRSSALTGAGSWVFYEADPIGKGQCRLLVADGARAQVRAIRPLGR